MCVNGARARAYAYARTHTRAAEAEADALQRNQINQIPACGAQGLAGNFVSSFFFVADIWGGF